MKKICLKNLMVEPLFELKHFFLCSYILGGDILHSYDIQRLFA